MLAHTGLQFAQLYEEAKFWGPLISGSVTFYLWWKSAKKSARDFADKMLDNHLQHIQQNTERTSQILADMHEGQKNDARALAELSRGFKDHNVRDARTHAQMLSDLSVLKDRGLR
jgi:hypothetical protein